MDVLPRLEGALTPLLLGRVFRAEDFGQTVTTVVISQGLW
jgi:hypothetical protein